MLTRATILTNEGTIEKIEVNGTKLKYALTSIYSMNQYDFGYIGPTGVKVPPFAASGTVYTTGIFDYEDNEYTKLDEKIKELLRTGLPQTLKTRHGIFNMEEVSDPEIIELTSA